MIFQRIVELHAPCICSVRRKSIGDSSSNIGWSVSSIRIQSGNTKIFLSLQIQNRAHHKFLIVPSFPEISIQGDNILPTSNQHTGLF